MEQRIERLLSGNETFYGKAPKFIATTLEQALNRLDRQGYNIVTLEELPDYHQVGYDGGSKDIFIGVEEKGSERDQLEWHTTLLRGEGTMHGWQTPRIVDLLQQKITELERSGFRVRHWVAITDHHNSAGFFGVGIGGFDGLKDMILCYHPRANLPQR